MTNKFFKTVALALAALTLSLPLSTEALAASHNDGKAAHKVEYRHDNHDSHRQPPKAHNNKHTVVVHKNNSHPPIHRDKHREPPRKVVVHHRPEHRPEYRPARHEYRPAPPPKKHHSATGNFVTGAIVGAVIGAIVANNT